MITIQELLFNRGLDKNSKTKLVRHKDNRRELDLYKMYRTDKEKFLKYQSQQGKDIFNDVDYIVSFVGEESNLSRFVGVYKILSGKKLSEKKLSVEGNGNLYEYEYEMAEVLGFEGLKERVIIKWNNPISWHQWIKNPMEVTEIQPGLHYTQFTDYFDFILTYKELKAIIENQYPDWKKTLSITKGIYLISDTKTGKLYVGSAYGDEGIWGRWKTYASTNGHGNNKTLKELVSGDADYARHFTFSILMLLPKTITDSEAIKKETLYKNKLGTNSFGLNNN
ncbi:MAG: GIY-YIG nuclease family protein [Bacteroidia bacterium]